MWTMETEDNCRSYWADVLVSLVRRYGGDRRTMWERVPNVCVSSARQVTTLERWLTAALRALQLPHTGSPNTKGSTHQAFSSLRDFVRARPVDEQAERRALRMLTTDTAMIVAEAMVKWGDHKKTSKRKRGFDLLDEIGKEN